jgi:hypothetical protein
MERRHRPARSTGGGGGGGGGAEEVSTCWLGAAANCWVLVQALAAASAKSSIAIALRLFPPLPMDMLMQKSQTDLL